MTPSSVTPSSGFGTSGFWGPRFFGALAVAGVLAASLPSGCAAGGNNGTTSGKSSSNDDGGAGGVGGGSGGEGAGDASPCKIDCSSVQAPDACNEYVCEFVPDDPLIPEQGGEYKCILDPVDEGTPCDDGLFCTKGEQCLSGECTGGFPNTCGEVVDQCYLVECDEQAEECTVAPAPDGTSCSSDAACEINAKCTNGLCIGNEKDCTFFPDIPAPEECWEAACNEDSGDCEAVPTNDGGDCVDPGDLCTIGKQCAAGGCEGGTPLDCSFLNNGCTNGACDISSGLCVQQVAGTGEECFAESDDCNVGECDGSNNCVAVPTNNAGACDDGDPCTDGETCDTGVCGDGTEVPQTVYFEEDFADNGAAWTLGTEWTIGSATASTGHEYGNPDPDADHTETGDNGVAGVVIGGNASTAFHAPYYLESPVVDTSGAAGSVWLGFYRWLNSDYAPYMINTVQVYDGATWITIWKSGNSPGVADEAWTQQLFELTAYKNADMRVRFGVEVGDANVLAVSAWNIDDVTIANVVCKQ